MSIKKTTKEIEVIEPSIVEAKDSIAKLEFKALIDKYALQNPEKYEIKKEALLAKLNTL